MLAGLQGGYAKSCCFYANGTAERGSATTFRHNRSEEVAHHAVGDKSKKYIPPPPIRLGLIKKICQSDR